MDRKTAVTLGLLAVASVAFPVRADTPVFKTVNLNVIPHLDGGKPDGCEITFNVVDGPPARWEHSLGVSIWFSLTEQKNPLLGMKVLDQPGWKARPMRPKSAYLVTADGDNRQEVERNLDDDPLTVAYLFIGPNTTEALNGLMRSGSGAIAVELPNGSAKVFPVDFTAYPAARASWSKCWFAIGGPD